MRFELVIVWETGETDVFKFVTLKSAKAAGHDMKKTFGNQISWYGVRESRC